jgi:hypothetical protein
MAGHTARIQSASASDATRMSGSTVVPSPYSQIRLPIPDDGAIEHAVAI